jgi:hypothetical protein
MLQSKRGQGIPAVSGTATAATRVTARRIRRVKIIYFMLFGLRIDDDRLSSVNVVDFEYFRIRNSYT